MSARFSPDGLRVITASMDDTARLWDARTGQPLSGLIQHEGPVRSAQFSPDGLRVVTTSESEEARTWNAPYLGAQPPSWLADLAEVIAGLRIDRIGLPEPLPPVERQVTLAHLRASPLLQATTPAAVCARWLLADPGTRTISPFSAVTVSEHLARIPADDVSALQEGLQLCPTNALLLARLASSYAVMDPKKNTLASGDADFLSQRALALDPRNPEIIALRAVVLSRIGRPAGSGFGP